MKQLLVASSSATNNTSLSWDAQCVTITDQCALCRHIHMYTHDMNQHTSVLNFILPVYLCAICLHTCICSSTVRCIFVCTNRPSGCIAAAGQVKSKVSFDCHVATCTYRAHCMKIVHSCQQQSELTLWDNCRSWVGLSTCCSWQKGKLGPALPCTWCHSAL